MKHTAKKVCKKITFRAVSAHCALLSLGYFIFLLQGFVSFDNVRTWSGQLQQSSKLPKSCQYPSYIQHMQNFSFVNLMIDCSNYNNKRNQLTLQKYLWHIFMMAWQLLNAQNAIKLTLNYREASFRLFFYRYQICVKLRFFT